MPHNQRTEDKAYKDMAQEMTKEKRMEEFKKYLQKIRDKRKKKIKRFMEDVTPPRYDEIYFEGIEWLNKNG